jgi:uncharacterized protein YgiB involved in biofilm formation
MKRSSTTKLLIMGVAPLLLAACDVPDQQISSEPAPSSTAAAAAASAAAAEAANTAGTGATVVNHQFQSVDECTKAGNPQDVCEKAFEQSKQFATAAAPHFDSRDACSGQYGADRCEEHRDAAGNSFWGPMMTGFMLSQVLNSSSQPAYVVSAHPIYQRVGGGYYVPSSGGWSSGASRSTANSAWAPSTSSAGSQAVTASRGGFGSIAAARGSWGGGGFGG